MHVFKAALLLIAVAGASTVSNLHSRQVGATRGLRATKKDVVPMLSRGAG